MGEANRQINGPARIVSRLRTVLKATGPLRFPWVVLLWTLRRDFNVAVCRLDDRLPELSSSPDLEPAPLETHQLLELAAVHPSTSAESMRRYLRQGARCFVWWIDGVPAHWRWETDREIFLPYLDAHVQPRRGDFLTVEVFTHPGFRDRGLYTQGSLYRLHQAKRSGYRRALGLIASWNRPALAVMTTKTGYVLAGTVGVWILGTRRWYHIRGAVPLDVRP